MVRPTINIKSFLISIGIIAIVIFTIGPDMGMLLSIFILIDLTFGFVNVVRGMRTGRNGIAAGGGICILVAMGSVPYLQNPDFFHVIIQVLGSVFGVSSLIVQSVSDVLDR